MNQTSNINTDAMGAGRTKPRRTRNLVIAVAATFAVAAAAPAVSSAAYQVQGSTGSCCTADSSSNDLGTTIQGTASASTKRLYIVGNSLGVPASTQISFNFDDTILEIYNVTSGTTSTGTNGGSCVNVGSPAAGYKIRLGIRQNLVSGRISCYFDVRVKSGATTTGAFSSKMLTWTGGASCSSGCTTFSGTVTAANPSISISGSGAFADTIIGDNSSSTTYSVTNDGNVTVNVPSTQSLTGTNSDQFSIVSTTCGATLAVSSSCDVVVRFSPTGAGAKAATLNVSPTYGGTTYAKTKTLSGTGLAKTYTATIQDSGGNDLTSYSSFADTVVGNQSSTYTFTVKNTGNKSATFASDGSSVALSGTDSADYTITATTCNTTVAADSTCTVTVRFNPSTGSPDASGGSRTATVTVTPSNSADGTNTIATADTLSLSANAVAQTRHPALYSAAGDAISSYDYGDVAVDVASPITYTLKNDGNFAVQGTGSANQSISGDNASDYAITGTTCGSSLAAGASCTIEVTFTPSASGTRTASLDVATTDGNGTGGSTVSIGFTGNGTSSTYIPELYENDGTTALSSYSFADTVGTLNSATYTVKLKNAGTAVLTGADNQSITGTDADQFSIVSTTCTAGQDPNSFCDIVIRFNPTTAGDKTATLKVATSNGTPADVEVALSGKAIQAVQTPTTRNSANDADISSYSFADTVATLNSATYNVTVKNTGNAPLSGVNTGQEITGADASDFSITATTCGASIAVDGTCTITIRFNPATQGAKTAQLKITPSDRANVDKSDATVDLSGTALEARQTATIQNTGGSATEASHAFADTIETLNSATYTFTLRNTGNVQLNGIGSGGQSISGTDSGNFSITATTCGSSLAANATCTITTRFNPQSAGAKSATLTVTPTDRTNVTSGVGTSTLTGTGIAITKIPTLLDTAGTNTLTAYTFPNTVRTETNSYTFTLKNTGNQPLNGTGSGNQSITGTDSGQYSITGTTCGSSLAVNATCTITVRFAPTTLGSKSANLQVNTTDGTSNNPALVALTGPVIQDVPGLTYYDTAGTNTKTTHDFGTVNVGGNSAYTLVLKNTGNVAVSNPSTQSVTGTDSAKFVKTSTTCGSSLAVNATCNIVITYTPTDTTPDSATVNVTGTQTSKSLTLSGQGGGVIVLNNGAAGSQTTSGVSHKYWLDSLTVGARSAYGETVRAAWDVAVEPGHDIQDVLVSSSSTTNDTAPGDGTFTPITGATIYKQPGGGNRQYVVAKVGLGGLVGNGWGTGLNDGLLNLCALTQVTNTSDRRIWFKLKDDQGKLSAALGSQIRVNDASWACGGSFTMLNNQTLVSVNGNNVASSTPAAILTPGQSATWSFQGQRKGSALNTLRWRIRNSRTGQMFVKNGTGGWNTCSAPCTGSGNFIAGASSVSLSGTVDTTFTLSTSFPARGRWVVEGVPLSGSDNNDNGVQYIGTALVNSDAASTAASSPTIEVTGAPGDRPNTNSSYTMTATLGDGSDPSGTYNTEAGAAKTIEWDLNNDETDGPAGDGFESRSVTGLNDSALSRSLDLTGKTPGSYTVRARVTDNGAFNVADPGRASKIYSKTFTINSPPVATDQTVDVEADETQPKAITLAGTDANGDSLSFTVPSTTGTGTLGGSDAGRTYSWPAAFTGHDTYTFVADDGKNATGNGTLTVRVRPNTTIDSGSPAADKATTTKSAHFEFSSPQSPISGYECRLLSDGEVAEDWASCSSSATGSKDYSDLGDGLKRFEVRAINSEGQKDGTAAAWTWRVDNTAPTSNLIETPASNQPGTQPRPTNDTSPSYRMSITDASAQDTATYECRVDFGPNAGQWKACGSPATNSGSAVVDLVSADSFTGVDSALAEGVYTFEVRATDEVGNTGPVKTETFRVDTTPPSSGITSGPEGLINKRDVTFGVSSTESGSTFRCRLVGESQGELSDGACPGGAAPAYSGLADDKYTFTATAIDPATNADPAPASSSFEIDATNPTTALTSGPAAATTSRRATAAFTGDDNRRLKGFECRIDSNSDDEWNTCQSPESYGSLADGAHKLEIRAVDEAANRDDSPIVIDWTIDLTAPSTTVDTAPAQDTNDSSPSVAFHSSEAGSSQCRLDGGSWTPCSSPQAVSEINGGPLADGAHRLLVRSVDAAGNVEATPAVASWRQDTVAPSIDLQSKPQNPSPKGDAQFGFTVRDGSPSKPTSDVAAKCSVDGGDFETCTSPLTISDPAGGSHTVQIRATDASGNTSSTVSWTWVVRSNVVAAPTIDDSLPANGSSTALGTAQFAFSHSDEDSISYECRVDSDAWQPCESPVHLQGIDEGDHTWSVRAVDSDGNRSAAATSSWSVNTSAPGTNLDAAPAGRSRSNTGKFRFSSNRAGATFECKLDRGSWSACESPYETAAVTDGTHTLQIRAVLGGTGSEPVVYDPTPVVRTWAVKTTSPETTLISAPTGTQELQSATFQFRSNERLATFQCKLDAGDYYTCASPALVTKLAEGAHTLYIRAVDPYGNRDESPVQVDWTVKPKPEDEVGPVTGSTTTTLTEGHLVFPGLSDSIALPAGSLVMTGDVSDTGEWTVAANGIQFPQITQAVTAGGLNIVAKISISAVGGASGSLPKAGGPASISFPAQLKIVVESDTGAVLIGPGAGCYLRPIQFDLTGNYDVSTHEVVMHQDHVLFPKTSAGCGSLGATVDAALGLPRSDISIAVTSTVSQDASPSLSRSLLAGNLIKVPVSCAKANACAGAIKVILAGSKATAGSGSFKLPRGSQSLVGIKLPKSVLGAIAKAGAGGYKVIVQMTPAGASKPTVSRTVTLYDRSARKQGGAR